MEEPVGIVCIHVLQKKRPVLFVAKPGGDLVLSCGGDDHHVLHDWAPAHASHFTGQDPALGLARVLADDEWAERHRVGTPWRRNGVVAH